jgi:hypothetical protein
MLVRLGDPYFEDGDLRTCKEIEYSMEMESSLNLDLQMRHSFVFSVINKMYMNLTFVGPCIVLYFYRKTNQMHRFSNLFYFWKNTLHVSDGLSVHHQESKTVHTASGICHTSSVAA